MRLLGPLTVVLALVFSTGGVAYQSLAGSADATSAAADAVPAEESGVCRSAPPRPIPEIDLTEAAKKARPGFKALNGTGYNYKEPGMWHPPVAVRKPVSAPAPAAPAPAD